MQTISKKYLNKTCCSTSAGTLPHKRSPPWPWTSFRQTYTALTGAWRHCCYWQRSCPLPWQRRRRDGRWAWSGMRWDWWWWSHRRCNRHAPIATSCTHPAVA